MVVELSGRAMFAPGVVIKDRWVPEDLAARLGGFSPRTHLGRIVRECLKYLPAEMAAELVDRITSCVVVESSLSLVVFRPLTERGIAGPCRVEDHGVVSRKVVTTAGVNFIVDAFQNTTEVENFKFHGIGTGSTAEASGDTALVTELTTEYNPNSTRATGSTTEGASANIYRTVGTNTLDSGTPALREHGVFSAASAGTLLDRSVFSTITLDGTVGDSLQSTYELTFSAGG